MSFGGGSAGSTGVGNHVHDNNTGEGGDLSLSLTNMTGVKLNSRVITNALVFG